MMRKPDINILKNERGIALLITLSIITILVTVSFELNRRAAFSTLTRQAVKTEYQLLEMAESGINIAKALLIKDAADTKIDSVQEEWANPEGLDEIVKSLPFDRGDLQIRISDEMGKIQVNALIKRYPGNAVNEDQKMIWETLLSFFISSDKSEDSRDPSEIINCLIDWLDDKDDDSITGISGAESSYYKALDIPYQCANREFSDLNDIFLVKGISKNLLSKAESLSTLFFEPDDLEKGVQPENLFTVFGSEKKSPGNNSSRTQKKYRFSGRININTAPVPVIAAILPFGKQDLAESISDYRTRKPNADSDYVNDLSRKEWYADVAGLTEDERTEIKKRVTYSSHIFSIEARVQFKERSLVMKNVVVRQKDKNGRWQCKTLRQTMD